MSHLECEFHEGRIFSLPLLHVEYVLGVEQVQSAVQYCLLFLYFMLLPINFSFKYKRSLS